MAEEGRGEGGRCLRPHAPTPIPPPSPPRAPPILQEGARAFWLSYPTTLLMNLPYALLMGSANERLRQVLPPAPTIPSQQPPPPLPPSPLALRAPRRLAASPPHRLTASPPHRLTASRQLFAPDGDPSMGAYFAAGAGAGARLPAPPQTAREPSTSLHPTPTPSAAATTTTTTTQPLKPHTAPPTTTTITTRCPRRRPH